MASLRSQIADAIVALLKTIDGTVGFRANTFENVSNKLIFWDEINDYPTISVVAGQETRQYLPGDFAWGFLQLTIRVYVKNEDAKQELEDMFADIEDLIDANNNLVITSGEVCTDIRIISISDDEGLLSPIGVGEILLLVQYPIDTN